jgi:cytosine/adenosine deaminase-related metal-dependent hydrolase
VRFQPGDPADLVAVDASSVRAAIAASPSRSVFRRGRLVGETVQRTVVHRTPGTRPARRRVS